MHKDTIAGLLLLALAGAYFLATRAIPDSSLSDAVGATGLPYVLAAALAILAAMLTVKGLLASRAARRRFRPATRRRTSARRRSGRSASWRSASAT